MKHLILMAALVAAPALAQTAPTPPAAPAAPQPPRVMTYELRGGPHQISGPRRGAWAQISPEGRDTLREALSPDRAVDRAAVRVARDRVNEIMSADRLDVAALRRAMDEENRLVDAMRDKRRAATLEAVQKLSVADRKAFAQRAQMGRDRMERRVRVYRVREGAPLAPTPTPPATPAN